MLTISAMYSAVKYTINEENIDEGDKQVCMKKYP
jgi:hypothetical protein